MPAGNGGHGTDSWHPPGGGALLLLLLFIRIRCMFFLLKYKKKPSVSGRLYGFSSVDPVLTVQ